MYLRNLEEVVIDLCERNYGLKAYRISGYTGVWVDNHKIAAIGIKVQRWVTMHGLSLNINPNMAYFRNIVPCGIIDKPVGSLEKFYPEIELSAVKRQLVESFQRVFDVEFDSCIMTISVG